MKNTKILLVLVGICTSLLGFSQQKKSVVTTSRNTGVKTTQNVYNSTANTPVTNLNREEINNVFKANAAKKDPSDKYFGMQGVILSLLTVDQLPIDVPVNGNGDHKLYKKMLIGWLHQNMDIVKEEYLITE